MPVAVNFGTGVVYSFINGTTRMALHKAGLAASLRAHQANVMPDKHMKEISRVDAYVLARTIAKRIVSGELSEYEGGMTIWKDVIDKMGPGCPDDLWSFKSNASAIEDIKWNAEQGGNGNERLIRQCEQEIFGAARKLADQVWRERRE